MTLINVASSIIYTKDAPIREKLQSYILAIIFLVLLYNSPSGLVFYWILNQIFSLLKNIIKKFPNSGRILHLVLSVFFVFISIYFMAFKAYKFSFPKIILYSFTVFFVFSPFIFNYFKSNGVFNKVSSFFEVSFNGDLFALLIVSCFVLALLCGLLLPSSVIASSPIEFSHLGNIDSPMYYIYSTFAFYIGLFVFWPICIYKLFGHKKVIKSIMPVLFFIIAICAFANVFLFKHDYGMLSLSFTFNPENVFTPKTKIISIWSIIFYIVIVILVFLIQKKQFFVFFMSAIVVCELFFSITKVNRIVTVYKDYDSQIAVSKSNVNEKNTLFNEIGEINPQFHLSKSEKNVVVLFLDRAVSSLFQYVLQEFPHLKNDFDGFVYYPNCLGFARYTNMASPPLLGGYEYTPIEMNKRSKELLVDKHNEALKLMPTLFSNADFAVTVSDLPYPNYKMFFEKKLFESIPNTTAISLKEKLGKNYLVETESELLLNSDLICNQRIKKFCLMEILPPFIRQQFYNNGHSYIEFGDKYPAKAVSDYAELYYLPKLTTFDSDKPTFIFYDNELTHFDSLFNLVGEDYHIGIAKEFDDEIKTGFYDPKNSERQITAYQTNAAALLLLGKWLNFIKENECYDNTRIIIVSDHGDSEKYGPFEYFSEVDYKDPTDRKASYNPLLIVKDFNSHGVLSVDYKLMTNAETPNLAIKDLPISNENPFSGRKLNNVDDFSVFTVFTFKSGKELWNPTSWEGKTQFIHENDIWGWTVHDDVFVEQNWKQIEITGDEK